MTRDDFFKCMDKFTNKDLFKTDANGNPIRDKDGNMEKINYDNVN